MYVKCIKRIRAAAPLLGDHGKLALDLIDKVRSPRAVENRSYLLSLHMFACMCDIVIEHTKYTDEHRLRMDLRPTFYNQTRFRQSSGSEQNYRNILVTRYRLVLACLENVPHTNPYSGESYD